MLVSIAPVLGLFPILCFLHKLTGVIQRGFGILGAGEHNREFLNTGFVVKGLKHTQSSSVGDLFMDSESDPQLAHLITTWNTILSEIHSNCYRGLHLHASPLRQLANAKWNLLEAHLGVIVNKSWLIEHDKYIRAAIMRTDGPTILQDEDIRAVWDQIQSGNFQPYLQSPDEMHHYLNAAIERYGADRIPFAGPECGLGSWDWKFGDAIALANLQNVSRIITELTTKISES